MAMPVLPLVIVGGLVAWALSGDDSGKVRPPWTKPIDVPGNDRPWGPIDDAICLCYEAGETEQARLTACTLARVYPNIGWPPIERDHVSVKRTAQAVAARVTAHLALVADGKDPCADVPAPPEGPATPAEISTLIRDAPASFLPITQAHNQNPSFAARNVYGLGPNDANVGRALVAMANVGYNLLLYSRRANAGTYGSARVVGAQGGARDYDIGPAWFPWNARILDAATKHERLRRWVNWSGTSKADDGDGAYGAPWMPPLVRTPAGVLVQANTDPWAEENNPPARVLAALGWTLDEIRTAWLAGNP